MTGSREQDLETAANLLMNARRTGNLVAELPEAIRPGSLDEAYAVQDLLAAAYGEIGGWKIGAANPDATPTFAPMPADWIAADDATLTGERWRWRGLEAEVAFLVGKDLPPRGQTYTREEVLAAMASCHPAIEVLETAYADATKVTPMSLFADLHVHGGFVYGPAFAGWRPDGSDIDFSQEHVTLVVDGIVRVERTGSNTAGDLLRLLPWLANEGAARTGGLRAGQWITTGSWTGNTPAASTSVVDVIFANTGRVGLRFG